MNEIHNGLREIIFNDIKRFAHESPPPWSKEQCDQRSALEKALALTMCHYVNYAYELGLKEGKDKWEHKLPKELFEI